MDELKEAIGLLCGVIERIAMTTEVQMGLGQQGVGKVLATLQTVRGLAEHAREES